MTRTRERRIDELRTRIAKRQGKILQEEARILALEAPRLAKPRGRVYLAIVAARAANPCATLEQLGHNAGVSRQRAAQILKAEGVSTKAFHPRPEYECLNCGQTFISYSTNLMYCSPACRSEGLTVRVECHQCGQLFVRSKAQIIATTSRGFSGHLFCSKQCQGSWLGANYGSGTPSNRGGMRRKWDYDEVYAVADASGWGPSKISRHLNIPVPTVSVILHRRKVES